MSKKQYFLIVDTETTMQDHVADFGAIICDRKGNIVQEIGILVRGVYREEALFYIASEGSDKLWSKQGKDRRFTAYENMLDNGTRMLASVGAINTWLAKAAIKYSPIMTAYNLAFDLDKCAKTGIDLTLFGEQFCLWKKSAERWGFTREYLNFALSAHAFNAPTDLGNMSYKTNAETMARFILDQIDLEDEPHTALEDAKYYELPILLKLVKGKSKKEILKKPRGFTWRDTQVRDHFRAK